LKIGTRKQVINMDDVTLLLFVLVAIMMVLMAITTLKIINKIVMLEKKMKLLMKVIKRRTERSNK
jgi:hypothetical protein